MNNQNNEISFCELRQKEVVNVRDGKKLGKIIDIVFSQSTSRLKGIVLPYSKRTLFSKGQDLFIPWRCVNKIGEDVIIVDINSDGTCEDNDRPDCDGNCDRCHDRNCKYRRPHASNV